MKLFHTFNIALAGLQAHKARSGLTILGIVIGITAIILVVSIGNGAGGIIMGELGGLGADTVTVIPGKEPKGLTDFAELFFADSLKDRELEALKKKENVPDVIDVAPEILVPGSVSYQGETFKPLIFGFSAPYLEGMFNLQIVEGTSFGDEALRNRASVAVIGSRVKEELFGGDDAVGKSIKIKDRRFKVVGVYEQRGLVAFTNIDELVLVPYTTAQTYLVGASHYSQIDVRLSSPEAVNRAVYDIEQTLRELHNIDDPEDDDFYVMTMQGILEQVEAIIGAFTLFLTFVVAIALVVGGVGVMNIMLVSVRERTQEIGLRKAIGATNKDILTQFLFEAIILAGIGGVIGVLLGAFLAFVASTAVTLYAPFDLPFIFPFGAALLGIIASALVGVVFGLYPARQASQKSPIEALRYE